jgi:hypothetical protein
MRMHATVLVLVMTVCAGHSVADEIDAKVEHLMASVAEGCQGYAEILTSVKWDLIADAASKKGAVVTSSHRQALYKMQAHQCMIVRKIQMLEIFKESTSEEEWVKAGGDRTLVDLRKELSSTIGMEL